MILVILSLIAFPLQYSEVQPLGANEQLYSSEAIAAMRQLRPDQQVGIWPATAEARRFTQSRLPAGLVAEANTWIDRVLASANLPRKMMRSFLGVRGPRYPDSIALRFRLENGHRLQIIEEEFRILVTVDRVGTALRTPEGDLTALKEVIVEFFRIPEGKLQEAEYHSGKVTAPNGVQFLVGSVEMESKGKSVELLAWWNRFWFQATGNSFTFTFTKSLGDGKPGLHKSSNAEPSAPGRFGNLGGS